MTVICFAQMTSPRPLLSAHPQESVPKRRRLYRDSLEARTQPTSVRRTSLLSLMEPVVVQSLSMGEGSWMQQHDLKATVWKNEWHTAFTSVHHVWWGEVWLGVAGGNRVGDTRKVLSGDVHSVMCFFLPSR